LGPWEVNLAKVLYGDYVQGTAMTPPHATQGSPTITMTTTTGFSQGDTVTVTPNPIPNPPPNPPNILSTTITTVNAAPPSITLASPWTFASGPVTVIDQEWTRLFTGNTLASGAVVQGKYVSGGAGAYTPTTAATTIPSATPVPGSSPFLSQAINLAASFQHFYSQSDFNGLFDGTPGTVSSRPLPPGYPALPGYPPNTTPTVPFPLFAQGYFNGGAESSNHPLLFDVFRPATYNGIVNRRFRSADMETLLRPNTFSNSPVDANASAVMSDLPRLCPFNFGPSANSMRYRNLVTTLSNDLVAPGVSPYWYSVAGTSASAYPNPTPPVNALAPPASNFVPFPTVTSGTPLPNVGNNPPTNPSEFGTDWRAVSAFVNALLTANGRTGGTGNGGFGTGRIRLNQPLPPYPHMGSGLMPPYAAALVTYGTAYNMTPSTAMNPNPVYNQYQAAITARQNLTNQIYRTLLALTGVAPAASPTPSNTDLIPRRWLAQLAVNIVDFIDEDDISTPFNFYTTQDDPAFTPAAPNPATATPGTQGNDDNTSNTTQAQQTGANPYYWVFGTELPKVVLNEVLAEATNPSPAAGTGPVLVWAELLNTMQATSAGTNNTQAQDGYRIPLYFAAPPSSATGWSPYLITIAQNLMPSLPTVGAILPDASANVLGKANNLATAPYPLPQSTTIQEFAVATNVQLMGGGPQPAPTIGPNVGVGIDPQGIPTASPYFLIGPPTPMPAGYLDPFVAAAGANPGVPVNTPYLRTPDVMYTPTTWGAASTTDERTTGLSVMLRRLANPYLPPQTNPTLPNYNPYVTADYLTNVPIQNLSTPPVAPATYATRVKRQPYAAFTSTVTPNTPPAQAVYSPVIDIPMNPGPPPAPATATNNNVTHTFGITQIAPLLPSTGYFDWLVHLDRAPISPMELLHVSGYQPYMLTQQFVVPTPATVGGAITGDNNSSLNMFHHYVPWLDFQQTANPATGPAMTAPWWFDPNPQINATSGTLTAATQTHRLYRLFEFLESGDRAAGIWGRIPGKVNINTIWDVEILRALLDTNPTVGVNANPATLPLAGSTDPADQIFANVMQLRSPTYYNTGNYNGSLGSVNMGNATDDRPFWPLSVGLFAPQTPAPPPITQQFPMGLSVQTDTLLRLGPTAAAGTPQALLFQNPSDATTSPGAGNTPPTPNPNYWHPYLQTQLLTKLYNNVTTRSNCYAVFLTVGFFQVTNTATSPPTLGAEIGRSEGRQVRHRMFALVDRTNLSVFSSTFLGVPNPPNPTYLPVSNVSSTNGPQTVQAAFGTVVPTNSSAGTPAITAGMTLVIEPDTDNEETVLLQAGTTPATFQATFYRNHAINVPVILRGNPGPWLTPYDLRKDPFVVRYFSIID
jgi:hypothetical protein